MRRIDLLCTILTVLQLASLNASAQEYPNLEDTRHDLAIYLRPVSSG